MNKTTLSVLITAFLFITFSLHADTNVLTNPDFENETTGWTARGGSISSDSSTVYNGSYSGLAYSRTATWHGIQQSLVGKMVDGSTYTISGWVCTSTSASSDIYITFVKTDDSNDNEASYQRAASGTASNSGWTYLSGSYTLNVTGTLSELSVYVEGPDSDIDIYVDDLQVYGPEVTVDTDVTGTIDINTRYQTIEGFGAAGAWYDSWLTAHPSADTLYDLFFDDLGLDIYRLRNTYDQDSGSDYMSRAATIITAAKQRKPDLKVLVSSWSPPTYLKSNSEIAGGDDATLIKTNDEFDYDGFADWWTDSITAWSGYGVDIDYVSIQNEPDYDASWDSCRFDPTESSTVAGYDQALDAVYTEMYSRFGSNMPNIIGPEATGFNGSSGYSLLDYLYTISNHDYLYGYCHHLYNINAGDEPDKYISSMQNLYNSYSSKPLFQTEYEESTADWPDAYNMALLLHNALTVEQVSGYFYWALFWAAPHGLVGFSSYGDSGYTINSDYYGFKQYSAFVHSDYQRVDTTDESPYIRTSAYISPDDNQLTVVLINTNDSTDIDITLSFSDIIILSGQIYRTSQTENCVSIGNFDSSSALTLPALSVTTLQLTPDTGTTAPDQPTDLTATTGDSTVTLNWNANTDQDLAGYNVYRSATSGSNYTKLNTSLITATEYDDNTVINYKTYYYVITAVDTDSNESIYSDQVQAMPDDGSIIQLLYADFETDLDDWTNITDDDYNWTRYSGQTPSPNTGPDSGSDDSTWYLYMETSTASSEGDIAILESPEISGYARSLSFDYHMYGADTGTLYVDIYDGIWNEGVYSISGQQHSAVDDEYSTVYIDLSSYTGLIQIRFRAEAAGGWRGDIAIDNIEVTGVTIYGDINLDNIVNLDDITLFAGYWLQEECTDLDINEDCFIDIIEFAEITANWLDASYQ